MRYDDHLGIFARGRVLILLTPAIPSIFFAWKLILLFPHHLLLLSLGVPTENLVSISPLSLVLLEKLVAVVVQGLIIKQCLLFMCSKDFSRLAAVQRVIIDVKDWKLNAFCKLDTY